MKRRFSQAPQARPAAAVGPAWLLALAAALLPAAGGCTLRRELTPAGEAARLDRTSPYLKAHMRNGDLFVLGAWTVVEATRMVHGSGTRYDENRAVLAQGTLSVPIGDVAIFETNHEGPHPPMLAALTIVSLLSLGVTAACIVNPKACFGSCPTFYVRDGSGDGRIAAEAFSASVAPALEARDLDALYRARPRGRRLQLRVTNEALETHVIRQADVLAAPRPPGGRVLAAGDGRFWQATQLTPPSSCRGTEGDCLPAVAAVDGRERASASDPEDLATREIIDLSFDPDRAGAAGPGGVATRALVIEARQTFITTFLFYQALANMGRRAGSYLAALERGDQHLRGRATQLHHLLGDIEVLAPDGRGGWMLVGRFDETGPIATDVQMVLLPAGVTGDRLRLRLTRGHWRLGHLALATLGATVQPARVRPTAIAVRAGGNPRLAADWLAGGSPTLVTGPGDAYDLQYDLPADGENLELFLDSRGYYIEWMREPWLAEESALRLAALFETPEVALRDLAPVYKRMEPQMEALFWKSRYGRPADDQPPREAREP
jgi:hypothetical protein